MYANDQEADRWKRKFMAAAPESRPICCVSDIKLCDPMTFPNIPILLKIACTLPVLAIMIVTLMWPRRWSDLQLLRRLEMKNIFLLNLPLNIIILVEVLHSNNHTLT